jgi:tripartite-type tricarboxylate transporter receptor subunit TctC
VESGYSDFKAVVWQGFSAPAGTPRAVIDRLNASAREALQTPEVVARFKELGAERVGSTPEALTQLIAREIDVWADVVRRSGVKAN